MIEAVNVTKIYNKGMHNEVIALKDVNLKIKEGEFLSIVGPSGSGKSTLLHILSALDRPTKGNILIDKKDTGLMDDKQLSLLRRNKIGFVFQTFNLIPTLSALENVIVPMLPSGKPVSELRSKGIKLLTDVGLGKRVNHKPSQLSGGENQRVTIARALLNNPEIVFADEPTGELDSKTGLSIVKLMRDLNKESKTTFVIVTHDESITKYTERILKIKDGKLEKDSKNHNHVEL